MNNQIPKKYLYASPVGKEGKPFLEKIIRKFGYQDFDFIIFVYDDTLFEDDLFRHCQIIYDKKALFHQAKEYLTPEICTPYEYLFFWMDDIDILDFDPKTFIDFIKSYQFEVAQPSLTQDSIISHPITKNIPGLQGRYTDFVEIMVPVFTTKAWEKMWGLIDSQSNPWGWGYDLLAYSYCHFVRMGIVDSQMVKHTRKGEYHKEAWKSRNRFLFSKFPYYMAGPTNIYKIKDTPTNTILLALCVHAYKLTSYMVWRWPKILKKVLSLPFRFIK